LKDLGIEIETHEEDVFMDSVFNNEEIWAENLIEKLK